MKTAPVCVVLVVDDEPIIADSLATILQQNGCQAFAAYSGEQAAQDAVRLGADVVISDVIMGEMNGVELAISLAGQLPACRILLTSGNAIAAEHLESGQRRGFNFPILAKPTHPNEILAFIHANAAQAAAPPDLPA